MFNSNCSYLENTEEASVFEILIFFSNPSKLYSANLHENLHKKREYLMVKCKSWQNALLNWINVGKCFYFLPDHCDGKKARCQHAAGPVPEFQAVMDD